MEGDVLDLRDDPSEKWGWTPLVGFVAGAVPLFAFAGFMFLGREAPPAPAPAAVLAPAGPPPTPVAPVRRAAEPNLHIKATGKTKVSTVGPAPEPPPMVVPEDDYPRYSRGGGGGGAPIYVAADPNPSQVQVDRRERPQSGVTYREAVGGDRDPLLPFGGSGHRSEGSSGRGASFSRQ